MKELVCLTNQPFIAGVEVAVLAEVPQFREEDASQLFLDDPWWGAWPVTVVAYNAALYPTFNTFDQVMFDATCRNFRCGNPLWWGKLMGYVIPRGSRVLVS